MKEGRELVKEALADAKSLKTAAVERAKSELVESLAPAVRKLLDESLRSMLPERGSRDAVDPTIKQKGDNDSGREQKVDYQNEDLTLEDALQEFFPTDGVKENNMDVNEKKSSKKSSKSSKKNEAFGKSSKKSSKKSSFKNEEIEISEAELRKVYEAAIQTEVNVKKGFSDIVGGGELADAHKEHGIESKEKLKQFADETPPHKQSWIPEAKELQSMVQKGLAENKALRENLRKAVAMVETLGKKLHEVNLFNAKVLHVNKILNSGTRLTKEQKTFVMESIDKARTISEVKMVFETIVGSIQTASQINESRNPRAPKANASGARTTGTPKQEVLSESVDRAQRQGSKYSRIQELAGLVK
jgi:hypothetical protein